MAKIALQGNDAGTGTLTLQAPVTNLNRNLVLPDVDGTLSTAEQVKLPIGSFMWFTGTVAPEAFVVADGELRSRAAFPDLWAFAQASGNISVDDASWTFGQYSPGDGATTFRVPKVDDRFIRGKSATRAVGLVEEDDFKSHTHSADYAAANATSGSYVERVNKALSSHSSLSTGTVGILNTGGTETRPKALTMLPCIKAYDVISDPNVLNAVGVVNEISRLESEKLRKDENINLGVSVPASGTAVDFVGIPEGVKRITVLFNGVSTNGASGFRMLLGAGDFDTLASYNGNIMILNSTSPSSTALPANTAITLETNTSSRTSASTRYGRVVLERNDTPFWFISSRLAETGTSIVDMYVGSKSLSGALDRLRITTLNGTDTFDAGTINISWEF